MDPIAILCFVAGGVTGLILGLRAGREGGREVDEVYLEALGVRVPRSLSTVWVKVLSLIHI